MDRPEVEAFDVWFFKRVAFVSSSSEPRKSAAWGREAAEPGEDLIPIQQPLQWCGELDVFV